MASPAGNDATDRSHDGASGHGKRSSPLGELSLDRLRSLSADPTREVLLGGLLAPGVVLVQIVGFYVLLLIRWAVGAHGAPPSHRWRYGALIAIPYTAIVLLTAILASLSLNLSVAALELDLAFRASLAWALLVLPVAAGLGAARFHARATPAMGRRHHRRRLWTLAARDFAARRGFLLGRSGTRGGTRAGIRPQRQVERVAA